MILLVSGVYTCRNNHKVPSHNPQILASLPSTVHVPFLLTNRAGFSTELVCHICFLMDYGVSFLSVEDIIHEQYQQSYFRSRYLYEDIKHVAKSNLVDFPKFDQSSFPFSHVKAITEVFCSYTSLFGKLFHDDMASRTSVWIFCDHTFKSAANIGFVRESDGKWIKLFKCVFIVIGEGGHILHWKFTRGESFEEVRDIFIQFKERLQTRGVKLRGVVIVSCCKWKSSLTAIFPDVDIRLDLFHALQRCLKTVPVGARIGSDIAKEYGLVFRRPSDLGEKRNQPTADKEKMLKNLAGFELKWLTKRWNGNIILNAEGRKALQTRKTHIERGCLSGIPVQCSTSDKERIHRYLNAVLHTNRTGLDLAYQRCCRLFFRINNVDKSLLASKLCCPRLQESNLFVETFGLPTNVSILNGSTAMLDLKSGKNESTQRLTPSTIDYVKDIVKSFVNSTSSEDRLYSSTHNTPLQIALDAVNFSEVYEGLKSLEATRFLSKSRLPSSIGLNNVSLMKQKDVIRSSENSLEHNPAQINETLTGYVRAEGLV